MLDLTGKKYQSSIQKGKKKLFYAVVKMRTHRTDNSSCMKFNTDQIFMCCGYFCASFNIFTDVMFQTNPTQNQV